MIDLVGGNSARVLAKEIADKALRGDYDLLLACRDLADLRGLLPSVAADVMDTFVAVSSEVDDLPIGAAREYWATEELKAKDVVAADYRERVRSVVKKALNELLVSLGETLQTH